MKINHLDHIAITVKDVEKSVQWYKEVLGLERRHENAWGSYPAMVCAGNTCIALFPMKNDDDADCLKKISHHNHFAFNTDKGNFEKAQSELKDRGIDFIFEDHDISHSIYLNDPDGHRLEITTYDV